SRLIEEGKFRDNDMKKMLIHGIVPGEAIDELGYASKLNADWGHLTGLMEVGRARANAWLGESFERIGVESTVDIRANYL
ncbi:MAG TPA: patatin-like phospholipase family protein, partial [Alphaproteobacteria bacterium]|nr:patatin-like phospholipase family protein [Alphaproteobacteria bacterium]